MKVPYVCLVLGVWMNYFVCWYDAGLERYEQRGHLCEFCRRRSYCQAVPAGQHPWSWWWHCLAVLLCSFAFWVLMSANARSSRRCLECLQLSAAGGTLCHDHSNLPALSFSSVLTKFKNPAVKCCGLHLRCQQGWAGELLGASDLYWKQAKEHFKLQ